MYVQFFTEQTTDYAPFKNSVSKQARIIFCEYLPTVFVLGAFAND